MSSKRSAHREALEEGQREFITDQDQHNFPLLRLPPELRNEIYALVAKTATYKSGRACKPKSRWLIQNGVRPLRLVCRQLNNEARMYDSLPQTLDLHTRFESRDVIWAVQAGRFRKICTIKVHDLQSKYDVWAGLYSMAFVMWYAHKMELSMPELSESDRRHIREAFPELRCIQVHGVEDSDVARLKAARYWRKQFYRPKLEVIFL